jgi:hypothetical protein
MIKFKIGKTKHEIPSSWNDVTFGQWSDLQNTEDEMEIVSIMTGIPLELVSKFDEASLYRISLTLGFMLSEPNFEKTELPEYLIAVLNPRTLRQKEKRIEIIQDIKTKTFGQKIFLQELLKQNDKDLMRLMTDVVLIYSQPQFNGEKFDDSKINEYRNSFRKTKLLNLYSVAMFYIEQLESILKVEAEVLHTEPTTEQRQAGINMFEKFGIMNTIRAMAGNDILKYDAVLEVEYNVALTHMAMSKTEGIFQDNYREVLKRKNK